MIRTAGMILMVIRKARLAGNANDHRREDVTSDDLSRSRISWSRIGDLDFNQVVEVLLLKMYDCPPYKAEVLRGAGGDGGIDVAVRLDGRVLKIFQLKYFPEGFTGGFRKTRRPQVKDSFDTAWRNHAPAEWILVMPPDPQQNERDFVNGLAEGKDVEVDIWGQEKLAAAMTDHPEVERAFLRDELVDVLRLIGQEKAGLMGATDLSERIGNLVSLANTRSKYWDTTLTTEGGLVFEDYVPKHPDAMEKEPIHTRLTFRFGPEHNEVAKQLRENLAFGLLEDLELPGNVASLSRTGPSWVAPLPRVELNKVRISPVAFDGSSTPKPLTLQVLDRRGFIKGRYEGSITRRASGDQGATLQCQLANVVTLTFKLPWPGTTGLPSCTIKFVTPGAAVRDIHTAIKLLDSLHLGNEVELYSDGGRLASVVLGDLREPRDTDEWTESLIDDLYVIEQSLQGVSFRVPEQTTRIERVDIRVARLLLEGYETVMTPGLSMSVNLNGEVDDALKLLLLEGSQIFAQQPSTAMNILGGKYDLGPGFIYHPHVQAVDGEQIWADLEAGKAAGKTVKLRPADQTPFRVWLNTRLYAKEGLRPPFRPWGIQTIDDPVLKDKY